MCFLLLYVIVYMNIKYYIESRNYICTLETAKDLCDMQSFQNRYSVEI